MKRIARVILIAQRKELGHQVDFEHRYYRSQGKTVLEQASFTCTDTEQGDGGDSCTWVIQRYQKMFPEQCSRFAAKVRFFNRDETRSTLGDLLAKYYRAANKNKNIKEEGDGDGKKGDSTIVESFCDMKDTIIAYTALFCEHPEFATEEAAKSFLAQARSENDHRILDRLVEWANAVVEEYLDGKPEILIEHSTPDGLLWDLQPFTYQLGGLEGQGFIEPWPLVSAVDFGLDHPLLNEGIVFVDSPGLSDANSTRSKSVILSHRECTHKIVVAEIGRAEANAAVMKNLEVGRRTRGSGQMLLVLTYGDIIDPDTEVTGTPLEKKRVTRLDAELRQLRVHQQQKQRDMMEIPVLDRDDLNEEMWSTAADIRKLATERDTCRLQMRNRKVGVKMQQIYKDLSADPVPPATFAVGNHAYQQHVDGISCDEMPLMSVSETNIPALRRKLYMTPTQCRLDDTMRLAETELPSLINAIERYCAQFQWARNKEIRAVVSAQSKLLRAAVHGPLKALKVEVVETILTPSEKTNPVGSRKPARSPVSGRRNLAASSPFSRPKDTRKRGGETKMSTAPIGMMNS
jgi:hypothetical protein